jgi:hypothetical protein
MDSLQVFATGATITTSGSSSRVALPTAANGVSVRYVRVAAINPCFVKVGDSSVTAASGDLLVQPADAVLLNVNGATHIAAIQQAAAGLVQISPVENM